MKTNRNPLVFSGERTLADYTTGFIGDAVLLPIMNAAVLFIILKSNRKITRKDLLLVAPIGLAADFLLHLCQGFFKLTNWSMPRPFEWDFVSYWHMVSFFFQISFVFLFFYLVANRVYQGNRTILRAVYFVFGLIGIFTVMFLYDYLHWHAVLYRLAGYVLHL